MREYILIILKGLINKKKEGGKYIRYKCGFTSYRDLNIRLSK